tara:strand:- start:10562 stop:11455 length:894 start_codon:yes stop_codon:yes gene_type:complete
MDYEQEIFYNEASASKLGWSPQWFGCGEFDEDLIEAIKRFQNEHNLTSDGKCGPTTYRRVFTDRESEIDHHKPSVVEKDENFIVFGGNFVPIKWKKVVLWSEEGGMKAPKGTYRNHIGKPPRDIKMFVNHWDVCLNSKSCFNVLKKRGISVHFLIDNDGTIYQTTDMQNVCWHAGKRKWNDCTVGVEISNAYYTKYQSWYERNGFGRRPQVRGWVHGNRMREHMDFYDVQKEAAKALWVALHESMGLPLDAPNEDRVSNEAVACNFKGIIHHYHLTSRKIDCGGWDINKEIEDIKGG